MRVIEQRCDSIELPVVGASVSRASRPSLLAESVPEHLSQVRRLRILVVGGPRQRLVWNTLIDNHHPCGMTTFAVALMRYLVNSEHGWLAALGSSAAALRLTAREQWVGWSDRQRQAHLDNPPAVWASEQFEKKQSPTAEIMWLCTRRQVGVKAIYVYKLRPDCGASWACGGWPACVGWGRRRVWTAPAGRRMNSEVRNWGTSACRRGSCTA